MKLTRTVERALITPRQREVWRLLALGRSAKEVGVDLGIAAKTVEHHRGALYAHLGAHNLADLTRAAVALRVITIELAPSP